MIMIIVIENNNHVRLQLCNMKVILAKIMISLLTAIYFILAKSILKITTITKQHRNKTKGNTNKIHTNLPINNNNPNSNNDKTNNVNKSLPRPHSPHLTRSAHNPKRKISSINTGEEKFLADSTTS